MMIEKIPGRVGRSPRDVLFAIPCILAGLFGWADGIACWTKSVVQKQVHAQQFAYRESGAVTLTYSFEKVKANGARIFFNPIFQLVEVGANLI
jgi:hypothetical protein